MNRPYPLLRLTPEAAGKLHHDHTRALARIAQLEAQLAALESQVRAELGAHGLLQLRTKARNAALANQLKQEIAA